MHEPRDTMLIPESKWRRIVLFWLPAAAVASGLVVLWSHRAAERERALLARGRIVVGEAVRFYYERAQPAGWAIEDRFRPESAAGAPADSAVLTFLYDPEFVERFSDDGTFGRLREFGTQPTQSDRAYREWWLADQSQERAQSDRADPQ